MPTKKELEALIVELEEKVKKLESRKVETIKPPDELLKIQKAMDYFKDRASRFGFMPPEDKSWVELRRLIEESKWQNT